jgi:hypothetical protein
MSKVWTEDRNTIARMEVPRFDGKSDLGGQGKGAGYVDGKSKDVSGHHWGYPFEIKNMEK